MDILITNLALSEILKRMLGSYFLIPILFEIFHSDIILESKLFSLDF